MTCGRASDAPRLSCASLTATLNDCMVLGVGERPATQEDHMIDLVVDCLARRPQTTATEPPQENPRPADQSADHDPNHPRQIDGGKVVGVMFAVHAFDASGVVIFTGGAHPDLKTAAEVVREWNGRYRHGWCVVRTNHYRWAGWVRGDHTKPVEGTVVLTDGSADSVQDAA